jgi:hypothetical protein
MIFFVILSQLVMKYLKDLDSTITDIETEIKKNPHPFLFSTLKRLKIYRDNEVNMFERERIRMEIIIEKN